MRLLLLCLLSACGPDHRPIIEVEAPDPIFKAALTWEQVGVAVTTVSYLPPCERNWWETWDNCSITVQGSFIEGLAERDGVYGWGSFGGRWILVDADLSQPLMDTVIGHEVGHVLGLGHLRVQSLMAGTPGGARQADLDAMCELTGSFGCN